MNDPNLTDSKQAVLDDLETRVQSQLNGRVRDLRLLWQAQGIVLRGFAETYHAKQLVQHEVMRQIDLPIFANEIEVT